MLRLFTIGHSNHSLEGFFGLARTHKVEVIADVRSVPTSQFVPHFNADFLRYHLLSSGFKYVPLGEELGGRPPGTEFYDEEGHVYYGRVAQAPFFRAGIDRLLKGIKKYSVSLMCSEEDPGVCHRHLLVGKVLSEMGVEVVHIRGDGSLSSYTDIAQRLGFQNQLGIFERESEWKSIPSVLPKKQLGNSSRS